MKPKILIVDDERPTREVMARLLGAHYDCLTAADAEQALAAVTANPDLVLLITDYKMPGENGIELIRKAKAANPLLGAIIITAFGEIDLAVKAMKDGADDFLTKPITDLAQLELRVAKAIKTQTLERQVADLRHQLDEKYGLEAFTGTSEAMQRVYDRIRRVAPSEATVLIEGPSGTGKELAAHAIHTLSRRANGPFVAVECSALSRDLLESELFGYEKNAFTGADAHGRTGNIEAAGGGTLFLDEIGEIDLSTQVKLLRVLETRTVKRVGGNEEIPVDFRLVAATNKDLAQLVAEGKFREDLYYRLNVIDIRMPGLREHREDIGLLVTRFIGEFAAKNASPVTSVEPEAMRALEAYDWPGNVRQLRNAIEKMVILATGPRLTVADLPPELFAAPQTAAPIPSAPAAPAAPPPLAGAAPAPVSPVQPAAPSAAANLTLAETEKQRILDALAACGGNKTKAADVLGISRRTLHRKLNEWKALQHLN